MYYKLTEKVYWGNYQSILELRDIVGSVICIAHDKKMTPDIYSPMILPPSIPYFKMSERDMAFPSNSYFDTMKQVIGALKDNIPMLVHCYMGVHRSPIISVMAAMIIDTGDYEYYQKLMKIVEDSMIEFKKTRSFNYSVAAQTWMRRVLCGNS